MAILDTQKVDFLWKKIGYGVTKTDTSSAKEAYNESISSPLLIRGDRLWQKSGSIPAIIPATSNDVVQVYKDGSGSWTRTLECTKDLTASTNRTWLTGITDWISPEFGSTYQIKAYLAAPGNTTPQTGTQIYASGSGNNDEWFFDYQAGVLNFIGTNLPSGISGKSVFISGARYIGALGVTGYLSSDNATLGNLNVTDITISSILTNSNINLTPNGSGNVVISSNVSVTGSIASGNINLNTGSNISGANVITANIVTTSTIISKDASLPVTVNTVIDSFPLATFRTAKYIIRASNDLGFESSEVLLIHDDTDCYITIYGAVSTVNENIIVISAGVSSGNIVLYASGIAANTTVNLIKTYIKD